jgi:hypothetical protein
MPKTTAAVRRVQRSLAGVMLLVALVLPAGFAQAQATVMRFFDTHTEDITTSLRALSFLGVVGFIRACCQGWRAVGVVAAVVASRGGEVDWPARLSTPMARLRGQARTGGPLPMRIGEASSAKVTSDRAVADDRGMW